MVALGSLLDWLTMAESEDESQVVLTDTSSESLNSTCGHAVESAVHHTTPDHPVRLLCALHEFPLQLDLVLPYHVVWRVHPPTHEEDQARVPYRWTLTTRWTPRAELRSWSIFEKMLGPVEYLVVLLTY